MGTFPPGVVFQLSSPHFRVEFKLSRQFCSTRTGQGGHKACLWGCLWGERVFQTTERDQRRDTRRFRRQSLTSFARNCARCEAQARGLVNVEEHK